MNKKKGILSRSLQAKLILGLGLCMLIVGGVIIAYAAITTLNSSVESAKQNALAEAENHANFVKAQIEVPLDAARTLSQSFASVKSKEYPNPLTRDQVNGMLRNVLDTNPQFVDSYTLWEPNA